MPRERLITPPFLAVMASNFAYFTSVGILLPTLPLYAKGPLHSGGLGVGLAIGSFSFTAFILRPWVGRLGDLKGRRLLIIGGSAIVAGSVLAYTLTSSLGVLVLLRLISGIGEAAFFVGAASAIHDLAPDDRRGEAVSLFSLSLYAGLTLGPVIGELVLGRDRFDLTWIVAAAFAAGALLLALRVPHTMPHAEEAAPAERARVLHPAALLPGAVLVASVWGYAGFNAFVPLYARDLGLHGSRLVFVTFSVVVLAIRFFGARLPDQLGLRRTARIALACSAVGLTIIAVTGNIAGLYAGSVVFGFGQALAFPALMTLAVTAAPVRERGAVVGTFTAFFDLSFGLGAVSLGGVESGIGLEGTFLAGAGVALGGLLLLYTAGRRLRVSAPAMH
jgi:MFS family permease